MENETMSIYPQAGSDEVGTGDTFGPVVVVCAIVDKDDICFLDELNIKDSKELTDKQITDIGNKLINKIKHSFIMLKNNAYNKATETFNLNEIKAALHNLCYVNLESKYNTLPELCIIDDFCGENKYFEYLERNKEIKDIYRNVKLETKAENKYISVAVASIIARYYFIKEFDELCKRYNMDLAKGSSNPIIDKQLKEIINKYGEDELNNVAKLHFKNVKNTILSIK